MSALWVLAPVGLVGACALAAWWSSTGHTMDALFRVVTEPDPLPDPFAFTDVVETLGPEGTWARGDFAAQAKARPPLTPYLFQMLDGRDPYPAILKTLRPHGDTRARARSEAIA